MIKVFTKPSPEDLAAVDYERSIVLFTPSSHQALAVRGDAVCLCYQRDLQVLDLPQRNGLFTLRLDPLLVAFVPGHLEVVPMRPMDLWLLDDYRHRWDTVWDEDRYYRCLMDFTFYLFFNPWRVQEKPGSKARLIIQKGTPLLELKFFQGVTPTQVDQILVVIDDDSYTLSIPQVATAG